MPDILTLILCLIVGDTLCANVMPLSHISIEDTINSMKQKMDTMEERLLSLESKENKDLAQKFKDELPVLVRDAVERSLEERSKHATKVEEILTDSRHERNERSVTLEELHQFTVGHKEDVDKRLSYLETALGEMSVRFDKGQIRFLEMDNHLLQEVHGVQKKTSEALEKIQNVEDKAKRALERDRLNIESLEVKENLTRILITSHIHSQRDVEEVIRKNISSCAESLRLHIHESSLGFENMQSNFTKTIRSIQNSMSEIEKDKGNARFVSKLDEDLKKLDKNTNAALQSIQAEIYPRVKQLEERCQMCDDVAVIDKTLKNHTSEIGALNRQLRDFQNSCSEPPSIENGFFIMNDQRQLNRRHGSIVTYACRGNKTLLGSGEMECHFGQWTGILPQCVNNCNTEDLKDYDGLYFPKNTMIEHSKSLEISCKEGYSISSISAFLFCKNGTWNVSVNICIEGTCDTDPPPLRNGKPKNFERQIGSHVQYECDRNFTMFGNSTVHCKSGKWKGHPPVCSLFDTTFYLETSGENDAYITCYSDYNSTKIEISRLPGTATDGKLPPEGSRRSYDKSEEISFRKYQYAYGIYKCGFKNGDRSTEIVLPLQIPSKLYFVDPFKVANVGDTVELELSSSARGSVKWKHNGVIIPSWDGKTKVVVSDVKTTDAGFYEGYFANPPPDSNSYDIAFLKLTVRKCSAKLYGERCDRKCPDCYNGGICHDILGICLCPDGFIGNNCEKSCPEGYKGADCSVPCRSGNCIYGVHCKPDPYGCFCTRGYNGTWCDRSCLPGAYGAHCTQSCHCKNGPNSCNRFTGACTGGCAEGWTGDSCQIEVLN